MFGEPVAHPVPGRGGEPLRTYDNRDEQFSWWPMNSIKTVIRLG